MDESDLNCRLVREKPEGSRSSSALRLRDSGKLLSSFSFLYLEVLVPVILKTRHFRPFWNRCKEVEDDSELQFEQGRLRRWEKSIGWNEYLYGFLGIMEEFWFSRLSMFIWIGWDSRVAFVFMHFLIDWDG